MKANSSATTAAITATTRLEVISMASRPTPPPVSSAPSLRPKMPRSTAPPIGTAKNRKIARSNQSKPALPCARWRGCCGSGSGSPEMRAISWSTPACSPPAKSPARKRGVIASSMIILAARSGTAPSSVLATSMRTLRSFLATTTSTPSPTSLRPIFQALPTRLAKLAMSSGCVVGTIRMTICVPFCFSKAASFSSTARRPQASAVSASGQVV